MASATAATPLRQLFRSKSGKLWEVCIGLEVHAQVLSNSKLMSSAAASTSSTVLPNRHVSFFDAALPGTLPAINRECVHQAIRTSLAVGAQVHPRSIFERKHYFYCDLPLGYQLTQQRAPIATNGMLQFDLPATAVVNESADSAEGDAVFDGSKYKNRKEKNEALRKWKEQQAKKATTTEDIIPRSVRIARIQIEQDSGKSNHELEDDSTLVDLNRAGTALMEIVMEPDLRSPVEAGQVMKQLQHLLRHLGVCDGNMEEGSMRCDLNVSVRQADGAEATPFGERVEVKNMNSIRNMMRAAEYEARRQMELIEATGTQVERETRAFDAVTGETKRMRSKEGAKDYRFFPEPDLPPLVVDHNVIGSLSESLPELPDALKARLTTAYGLTPYESSVLVNEAGAAAFFESVAQKASRPAKLVVNWILNELFSHLKASNTDIPSSPVSAEALGELIDLLVDGVISGKIAKDVLEIMYYENLQALADGRPMTSVLAIVEAKNWKQIQDETAIRELCLSVLEDPKAKKNVEAYRNGKTQLFGFFIGQVMKACDGRVHPERANAIMQELLDDKSSSS
ncbi:hypothetical protein Poli38472_003892 [Pythium oligandrum]|uniref:Glutamyl-tRNA(Gln) amidotransferase subunit B, mitochondrial n=1 Tax=Pythium oligandrum TaxID=41045 RepID=A0A8K1CM91_PYTOL|nr:hypothetical protein Poli38472_003892 [Pythium oligandrum]|eukprot:TMW66127.1 hypothetical protein Poli38472_003892 [Pythium oligandrum]